MNEIGTSKANLTLERSLGAYTLLQVLRAQYMQSATESPRLDYRTMPYQVARDVLIWTWWKRVMFTPRTIIALSIWLVMAVVCLFLPGGLRFLAVLPAVFLLLAPFNVYQLYAKAVDGEPQLADEKTLEFGRTRLAFTGPDWRNEMTWKRFKRLSENPDYFFLDLRHSNLAVVIPKGAFSPELELSFRECAKGVVAS